MPTPHALSTTTTATLISIGFLVIVGPLVAYLGAAVAVALFHRDKQRRADARAVLHCLANIVARPRKR